MDIFNEIIVNKEKDEASKVNDKMSKKDGDQTANNSSDINKEGSEQEKTVSEKSSNNRKSSSNSKTSSNTSKNSGNKTHDFQLLANAMTEGFSKLQETFLDMGNSIIEKVDASYYYEEDFENENYELDEEHDSNDMDIRCKEPDIFETISNDVGRNEESGPPTIPSLGNLANKLLKEKMGAETAKNMYEKYLNPMNVDFANAPKINKPVWENISQTNKVRDCKLQGIQKDVLKSSLPILKVMEKLFKEQNDPTKLCVPELIKTLSDSLVFIGSANFNLVQTRKDFLKPDLPKNMQGLCREEVKFTGTELFGDDLNSTIKNVTELNKVSNSIKGFSKPGPSYQNRGNSFGHFKSRGRFIRGRGRMMRRYTPYSNRGRFNSGKLNRRSLSRQ